MLDLLFKYIIRVVFIKISRWLWSVLEIAYWLPLVFDQYTTSDSLKMLFLMCHIIFLLIIVFIFDQLLQVINKTIKLVFELNSLFNVLRCERNSGDFRVCMWISFICNGNIITSSEHYKLIIITGPTSFLLTCSKGSDNKRWIKDLNAAYVWAY